MTLEEMFRLLVRRWWLVLALAAVGGVTAFAVEGAKPNTYRAAGRIVIGPALDEPGSIIESTGALSRGTLPQTLAEMVTGSAVVGAAYAPLIEGDPSRYEVDSLVIAQTNVVEIVVTGPSLEETRELTNALMEETETVFERLYPIYDVVLLDEPGGPSAPVSPDPVLAAFVGVFVGSIVASVVVMIEGELSRRRRAHTDSTPAPDDSLPGAGGSRPVRAPRIGPPGRPA